MLYFRDRKEVLIRIQLSNIKESNGSKLVDSRGWNEKLGEFSEVVNLVLFEVFLQVELLLNDPLPAYPGTRIYEKPNEIELLLFDRGLHLILKVELISDTFQNTTPYLIMSFSASNKQLHGDVLHQVLFHLFPRLIVQLVEDETLIIYHRGFIVFYHL